MSATLLMGKTIQQSLVTSSMADAVAAGVRPAVSLISVHHDDPMLAINRQLHLKTLEAYGFDCDNVVLPAGADAAALDAVIESRNAEPGVHGIMVLLPLPAHLSIRAVLPKIARAKELEGLHPEHSVALLQSNEPPADAVLPLVGEAIRIALDHYGIPLEHRNIVLLTEESLMRSNPIANMVVRCAGPAMLPPSSPLSLVPIDHRDARRLAVAADILIVSLERPEVVTADWIKPGATVIDFNPSLIGFQERQEAGLPPLPVLRGGVLTADVATVAGFVMPIPGGVGPVMLGILMRNAVLAALRAGSEPVRADDRAVQNVA